MCGTVREKKSPFLHIPRSLFLLLPVPYQYSNVWLHFSFEYFLVSLGSLLLALRSAPTGKVIIKQITPQGKFSSSDSLVFFIYWDIFCHFASMPLISFDILLFWSTSLFGLFYVVCSLFPYLFLLFRLAAGWVERITLDIIIYLFSWAST